jgi:hypothetical protein
MPNQAAITSEKPALNIDNGLIVNGDISVRRTHPTLYRSTMFLATLNIALGLNFFAFEPTFYVYDQPHELWGTIFIALGVAQIVFLNFYRHLRLMRATMALSMGYMAAFGLGTMQPAFEGKGSLQLPIVYGGFVAFQLALLLEPFINPWTAKRDV